MQDKVNFNDFQKLDMRIGTVVKAEVPEWSHWVIKLTVDLGSEIGEKTVFAGIMHYYKPEEIEGKQFPFVINLEPKKIGPEGDFSEGMMMAGDGKLATPISVEGEEVDEKPILLSPWEEVAPGTRIA